MSKRAVLYSRVSTSHQSVAMQVDVLREHALRRGFKIVDEFIDKNVSGSKDRRPELDRLMDAARKREFDILLVYKFDRFTRSVKMLVNALAEFDALGIGFISYSENLATDTPMGKAMFQIIGALAELERSLIVERAVEGQRRARARGKHVGRPRIEVNPERVLSLRARGTARERSPPPWASAGRWSAGSSTRRRSRAQSPPDFASRL